MGGLFPPQAISALPTYIIFYSLPDLIKLILNIISCSRWFYDEAACAAGMATLPMLVLLMLVLVRTELFDLKKTKFSTSNSLAGRG